MNSRQAVQEMTRKDLLDDPRIVPFILHYSENYMGKLGPFVSSVFFVLLTHSRGNAKKTGTHIKSVGLSISQIADLAGISKRKTIDALKVLKRYWIIVQHDGRGRGNKNRYYFVPIESWCHLDGPASGYPGSWQKVNRE
ncbi:MAG: hypothetical protein ABFD12_09045 [Syntrophorhabdus sp.]